ncbi:hypothetical protein [Amycolatopsis sp. NPDC051903]|uniref:hypothetical protein n=1 Tax=Amycolatopsis sp. NPDC051903 TaxID=3363936 RepID=UPI0037BB5644
MSLWTAIGYSGNPYGVEPLKATAVGADLMVGRERELRTLTSKLRSTDTHPTIEGENGVGKTSLVSVAAYRAQSDFEAGREGYLLLPTANPLQIADSAESFERSALLEIIESYIAHEQFLQEHLMPTPPLEDLKRWLTEPLIKAGGMGASVLGFGVNGSTSASANTTAGFGTTGLRMLVKSWLAETFDAGESGAFVAVIDNLELLQTSVEARRVLEEMRDGMLSMSGIRWVLCGSKGIVRSAASSPRMSGRLSSPIELSPVGDDDVPELIRRRLAHFSSRPDPEAPVSPKSFSHLYQVANKNLRNALKHAQDFAIWLESEDELHASQEDKEAYLEAWMAQVADEYTLAADLQPAQWRLFDKIADKGGSIAPGDYESFGFNTPQAMRAHLVRLEQANLIDSTVDETDQRRRTISITSTGWLVRYRRQGFQ